MFNINSRATQKSLTPAFPDFCAIADLYSKIKDSALRAETLTRHVREWLTKDPAAARAWLESNHALTPEQTAALLAPAK